MVLGEQAMDTTRSLLTDHLAVLVQRTRRGVLLYELVYDASQTPIDYRILDCNPAYELHAGVTRGEAVGNLASDVYSPRTPLFLKPLTRGAVATGSDSIETWGTVENRYFSISIVRVADLTFVATLTDMTDLKHHELELSRRASVIGTMIENQPYLAWLKDKDGHFLAVNTAFARACGRLLPEQVVGKTDFDVWPSELAQRYVNDDRKVMSDRQKKVVEEPILEGDRTHWFETFKSPIVNEQGEVIGTVGYSRDISERKRAEEDRRKLEQQVMHAQKLESLGVLAGGIAHDFNNLLTSILGNADLALAELSPVAPACEHVRDIVRASRRAADLCRQMLAYSGKGRFVVQPLSLNDIVREMAHLLSVSISKKAVLKYNLEPDLPFVRADATQIRQIVMNLITNASEAIGDRSGVIALTTGVMDCDASYLAGTTGASDHLEPGQYSYLEVSDTGHGMDRPTLDKIFDPFFTTKFTGRGLGLAAVLGIVRGHNGGIRVYSEPGKGSVFKMLLPACDAQLEARSTVQALEGDWQGSGLILLVDDEESIRSMGRRMLEKGGFRVITASDGVEALELFKQHQQEVRLVVLDMTMPHMDGEVCFRELRRLQSNVKVIMTSGYNEQDIINRFVGKGLAGFLQKPYTIADLLPRIRELLTD